MGVKQCARVNTGSLNTARVATQKRRRTLVARLRIGIPSRKSSSSSSSLKAKASDEHCEYIENATGTKRTETEREYVKAMIAVFVARGHSIVSPQERRNKHPLVVPISFDAKESELYGIYIPHDDAENLSVVKVSECGRFLMLLARNAKEYVHGEIVREEHDTDGCERAIFKAAGECAEQTYVMNDYLEKREKLNLDQYLTMKVGRFPSSLRGLVERHLERKDEESALVACDVFKNQFQNWGEVYAFISDVYASLNRTEEARDYARSGVQCPWSTFQNKETLDRMIERAGWGETPSVAGIRKILDTRKGPGRDQFVDESKEKVKVEEDAEDLLNAIANGEMEIKDAVIQLADAYSRAGKEKHSKFVSLCALPSPF